MSKPIDAEIILVGNELLKGERRDAHLAVIAERLARVGVRVGGAHVIGDDRANIADLVRDRTDNARLLIVCGGLGPTHDDVTREGVADGLGLPLEWDEREWENVQRIFRAFGTPADESNRRQCYFPKGATPLPNPKGTAAGFVVERGDLVVAVLPGPPLELVPMLEDHVIAYVDRIFKRPPIFRETYRTAGIGESSMTPLVVPIFESHPEFTVSSLPHVGGVDLVITQRSPDADPAQLRMQALAFEKELRAALGDKIYATGATSLEATIGELLATRGETLAVAESLTGGGIGARITGTPGSSAYFLADIVAYSDDAKTEFLGVNRQTLDAHGAVSEAVCGEMADGARRRARSTYALATTGIAGPAGGTKEKPVGLTYFGLAWDGGVDIRHRVFPGDRASVRRRVTFATLGLLHQHLRRLS